MTPIRRHALPAVALAALATGCATGGVSRADLKTAIDIQYGVVDQVEQTTVESQAAGNAILGGVIGAVASRKHRLAGAAVGAASAGLLTAAAEGSRQAFAYTVRLESGRVLKVIVEHGEIAAGQCVAVEQGRSANLRLVSPGHCRAAASVAARSPEVAQEAQADAEACHQAKEQVLAATTEQETTLWAQKARILCGH
jgi:hypothetical protein